MPSTQDAGSWAGDGRLILAATPIGDPADAPARLARLIATADVVAAEDTRRLRRLASALGVSPSGRVVSFHEHNETARAAELVAAAESGATVLVVTDAGMPSVSDPGLRAVRAAVDAGIPVTAVPGPSAVLTALALSGLASDRFCFEGFLPRKPGERRRTLAALQAEPRTMVFFEAPHRLAATLADLADQFGPDRPAAVARELTKTYEEVLRQPLGELAAWAASREVLGEITLVVAGRPSPPPPSADDIAALVAQVRLRVDGGQRLKDAVAEVAAGTGVPKRELYDAATRARG
ncbi:MAG TPA: 16S rRNA (cytidine(1402)-2'-O)-methyltransferase [Kineosporiaceae bacterium]|nr:16S rRNA (cytidine(1402)-2'-O)-methyltransferase [Kineosporiaceae bacterium]